MWVNKEISSVPYLYAVVFLELMGVRHEDEVHD